MATARNSIATIATIPAAPDGDLEGLYGAISSKSPGRLHDVIQKLAEQDETRAAILAAASHEPPEELRSDVIAKEIGLIRGPSDTLIDLQTFADKTIIDDLKPNDGE